MPTAYELPVNLQATLDALPMGLVEHIQRVRALAAELAEGHKLDVVRVDFAAAAHDIARAEANHLLLAEAQAAGIPITNVDEDNPMLLHGPVGAERLRTNLDVNDEEILEAVYWHTTALATMGPIAKVVFLADKMDLSKAPRYPHIGHVRELAADDLDQAIVEFLKGDLIRLLDEGKMAHPSSIEALNGLLYRLKKIR
ncbi:MAG: bis(5'-nucleosyl)-tetraphosphatase (symmetrical) YqeK [Chloroflexota bacterium]|nr:bis(5'-nucleosyl)-tetraphosphatase (symmetrical) YqeK [Chloroflexota bacterium]